MSKNHIDMSHCANTRVVDVMADVDFTVADPVDSASAIQQVVLEQCRNKVPLVPGKYNIRILAVITSED